MTRSSRRPSRLFVSMRPELFAVEMLDLPLPLTFCYVIHREQVNADRLLYVMDKT